MFLKTISYITICIIASFCLIPFQGKSQFTKGQSELSAGIGFQSDYELITKFTDGDNNNYAHTPDFSLSYRYYLTGNFSLGLNVAYQHFVNYDGGNTTEYRLGPPVISSLVFIAPEITFSYLNKIVGPRKNELRLYGVVSVGIAVYEGDRSYDFMYYGHILPAFQLSPIGVRFGKTLAGYMEAGFGNKGLINAGLSYRFPKKKLMAKVL